MAPDQVIKHVSYYYPAYWSVTCRLERSEFEALIAPWLRRKLKDYEFSRLRGFGAATPKALLEVLTHQDALHAIAVALKCPALFTCSSAAEVDAMLAPLVSPEASPDRAHADDSLITPQGLPSDILLSAKERSLVDALADFMLKPRGYVAHWPDPPQPGGAVLAYVVAEELRLKAGIATYVVRPFANACANYLSGSDSGMAEVPYESAVRALASALGLHANATPMALLDRLVETNSTVFVLHAESLEPAARDRSSAMRRLVLEAKERVSRRATKSFPIVLVGTPRDERLSRQSKRFNDKHGRYVVLNGDPPEDAGEFFEAQWRRYCQKRGYHLDAEAGSSRRKRVRHYYISDDEADAWPATLRLHAFFASNFRTFTYFDPTAGWAQMTGMQLDNLPIDIALHLGELIYQLRQVDQDRKRWPAMRGIRWCSTALYWLTSDAALVLGKGHEPNTDLSTFHGAMEALDGLVKVTSEKNGGHTYKMDLAARAAIQDRWRAKDPRGRAEAHRLIASRLLKGMNDKELLSVEFPIEPHWGRSRMHFLAEAIRHLVRTCDHVERPRVFAPVLKEGAETFPECTTDEFAGCDPFEVINYCFGVLYWRELNGNGRGKHHSSRKLALRHGAYHLTGELLQLMSEGQEIGKPHWALNEVYISRYLREVAYSQLDLGDLRGAKATFESLIARARMEGQDPLDVIDYQLDLIVVLASMDDLSEAEATLADARNRLALIVDPGTEDSVRLSQQLQTRIRARQAHLSYLRADYQSALDHCVYIEENMPAALVRDVAHTYISTLGAMSDDRRNLEKAIKICVRQLFDNTSRGLHHEALGFRVALGRAFRKLEMLQAAEAALDGVYEDVLQYGCAERTYLALLLEAGRVLDDQGRHARAYASYLRPCFERAKARGYKRVAEHARTHARRCIERMLDEVPEGGWPAEEVERRLSGRGEYLLVRKSKKVDPRSSFDTVAIDRWAPRLLNRSVLQRELDALAGDQRGRPLSDE